MAIENRPVSFKANLNILNYNKQLTEAEVEAFKKIADKLGSKKDTIEITVSDFFQHLGKSSQNASYVATKGSETITGEKTRFGLSLLPERMTIDYVPILMHMKEKGKSFYTTVMRVGDTTKELVTDVLGELAQNFYKK